MPSVRVVLAYAVAVLCAGAASRSAFAQMYPSKPIRLIVPGAPGAATDIRGRWLADQLARTLGQPIVVDNRFGAGGTIATGAAAKSAPDGYTLLLVHQGTLIIAPHIYPSIAYDPATDFAPVTRLSLNPLVLAVNQSVPVTSVAELLQLARAKPGQLVYGSPGSGSPPHLAAELFKSMTGIAVTHVPYKGGGAAVTDLAGGRLTYTFDNLSVQLPFVKAGKTRAVAVTGARRLAALPATPTIAEAGVPGYDYQSWMGIAAPAKTPKEIVSRLHQEMAKILSTAEAREWFGAQGAEPGGDTPAEFAAFIKVDTDKLTPVIRKAGIKAD